MNTNDTNLEAPTYRAEAIAMVRNHVSFAQDGGVDRDNCWDNLVDTLGDTGCLHWFAVVEAEFDRAWPTKAQDKKNAETVRMVKFEEAETVRISR
jgi:hypothetical protein